MSTALNAVVDRLGQDRTRATKILFLTDGKNEGLTEQVACPIPGTSSNPGNITIHQCDDLTISAEITLANKELFNAAHNVTYPGERTAVERITAGFLVLACVWRRGVRWIAATP